MRSLRTLSFFIEAAGSLIVLGMVFLLLATLRGEIKEQAVAAQRDELTDVEYTIATHLGQERDTFARLAEHGVGEVNLDFLPGFADIYYTDQAGVITRVLRQEKGSRIFPGYNLSAGQVGKLLAQAKEGRIIQSPMIRSAEHDTVSVYIIARQGQEFLIGRIDLDDITGYLRQLGKERKSILIIASPTGYIISSTQEALPFQVLPEELVQTEITEDYLFLRARSAVLGNDLVMLTPKEVAFGLLQVVDRFIWVFALAMLLIIVLKLAVQQRYFIGPLGDFLRLLRDWQLSSRTMTSMTPLLHTEEIQALYQTFTEKSAEIETSFTQVEEAREALEGRVQERTMELTALNQELRATNEELNAVNEELAATNDELSATLERLQLTQERLVESEKMAALGSIVVGVAHEINTPLGNGVTTASFLRDATREAAQQMADNKLTRSFMQEYLQQMSDGAELVFQSFSRAAKLVDKFKMISGDPSEERKVHFNVLDCLQAITAGIAKTGLGVGKEITVLCPPDLQIYSYPLALTRIVSHLIDNSLLHAFDEGRGGTISISVTRQEKGLELVYSDDGKGIDPAIQSRIFDPFFTTRRQGQNGSGLGLSIVYTTVVNTLGGTIKCQSLPKQGTSFVVFLPLGTEGAD